MSQAAKSSSTRTSRPPGARGPSSAYDERLAPRVLVDSHVLIDVLENDPKWCAWLLAQLAPLIACGRAAIVPIIYAEVAADFSTIEALEAAIEPLKLARETLS